MKNDGWKIVAYVAALTVGLLMLLKGLFFGLQPTSWIVILILAAIAYFIKPSRNISRS